MSYNKQLANTVVAALSGLPEFKETENELAAGNDISLATPTIIRAAYIFTQFRMRPRTILVVTESEEAADTMLGSLAAYFDGDELAHLALRDDFPWQDKAPKLGLVTRRVRALHFLSTDREAVVVASVQALMRSVPLDHPEFFAPLELSVGLEIDILEVVARLVEMGYTRADYATDEGMFALRGDVLDIHPAIGTQSVRVEFFGDVLESVKRLVPGSGQTLGSTGDVVLYPLREISLTGEVIAEATMALEKAAFLNPMVAYHRDLIAQRIAFNEMEGYLPLLVKRVGSAAEYLPAQASVAVLEPRILFDVSMRAYEEYNALAMKANFKNAFESKQLLSGLFLGPAELNFGSCGRLTWMSTLNTMHADVSLLAKRPDVAGSDARLVTAVRNYLQSGYSVTLCLPNRRIRERVGELLVFEGIPVGDKARSVKLIDHDAVVGFIVPDAGIAVIAQSDAFPRAVKKIQKRQDIDITKLTFPFKPGDYIVHSSYGIALFKEVTRRIVDGVERDYLHLQYAGGDTLYTPIDQIDRVTKYVGSDGGTPKVTRLGTKSWTKATARARAAAKKLAIDLVDLYARRSQVEGYAFSEDTVWQAEMEALFPYEETPDQLEAIADVKADMESSKPMDRLVCGDVGYGKTEVAIRATFKAVQDGKQVMILCPTTILAQQHYTTFSERFAPFGIEVEVLSRFRSSAQQRVAVEKFAEGTVKVLVGTHRLLSKDISPYDLGLLIIDEEQRFGVEHKEKLKNMRANIDVFAMSATPIPRTLQMSLSGVRDMSVIDTPPANRYPVKVHVGEWDEDVVSHAIRNELSRNGQVYYVSNRVKTIEAAVERVRKAAPEARIGVAHGQMSEHQLEEVMEQFAANEIDVLIATTIVESGIDNPHSNTLVIENAHMLGLSQLYQLKGRVGRSHVHAFAYFLYPLGVEMSQTAIERLMAIAENDGLGSGIRIAMRDLEIRGAGSIIGAEQSGQLSAVGFDLFAGMISEAVAAARGEAAPVFSEIRVDLPEAAFIPEEYIEDVFERVVLYRRIAGLATKEGIDKLYQAMVDAHGTPPVETQNLFDMTRIKVICAEIKADAVTVVGPHIQVRMPKPDENVLAELRSIGALYDDRRKMFRWKIPYGESVVKATRMLVGAILFDASN
ncbi:MAG: transcription-repair coupling factor [Coriobacteriia bacterium]|nr:transcription-repair coupling factor [Coriobacteriia bacterium]